MLKRAGLTLALLIAALLLINTITLAIPPLTPDLKWKGRLVVEFNDKLGNVQVNETSGTALIGDPDLDALAYQYSVRHMEKLIPGSETPQDVSIRDLSSYYILEFPPEIDLRTIADSYAADPMIISAEPYQVYKYDYTPSDPYFSSQWAMTKVNASTAFNFTLGSPTVIVGVVDSGIDTAHADLRANLWVNPGEDLNHNGIIDITDWNGYDDDGNGYIDDFWGWNVWQGGNNVQDPPMSQNGGHGTHCSGDASARIDNGIGIASLGGKAKIMMARAGDGQYIYAGMQGISYVANNHANAISLSWGGSYSSSYEQSVITNAWNNGALIFAAAGNESSSSPHYPAAYTNVVAVAATNTGDQKSSYSNYGTWIDVCSPGDNILSTIPPSAYGNMSGTSMACPIAAGLGAMIKAVRPSYTNAQILQHIYNTCDNIYPQNPGYTNMLGHGRINAANAMTALFPVLGYTQQVFDDASGNNNGRPDPGETVNLRLTIQNTSTSVNATGVTVTLYCADPAITVQDSTSLFGDIPFGQSRNNSLDLLTFYVNSNAEPHEVTFRLTLHEQSSGLTQVSQIIQMVGQPYILLVDDDGGFSENYWYEVDLDSLGKAYDYWNVQTQGNVPLTSLQQHSLAIWHTSNTTSPLNATEQTAIQSYLNGGGHLFLTGENIDEQFAGQTFYTNVLHCTSVGTPGSFQLTGITGDPISNGTTLLLAGAGGAGNSQSPATITPQGTAERVYNYNTNGLCGGLRWNSGNTKLVYFSFCFEAASGISSTLRRVVLNNVISWMQPAGATWDVNISAINPPIVIPANGGSFQYNCNVHNLSTTPGAPYLWNKVKDGAGNWTTVFGPITRLLPGGANPSRVFTQTIAASVALGTCYYVSYLGPTPTTIADSSFFTFTKSTVADGGLWVSESKLYGDFFEEYNTPDVGAQHAAPLQPEQFELLGASPNPFNPTTNIRFNLPNVSSVTLTVYDINGRVVGVQHVEPLQSGAQELTFDGSHLSSGVYLYKLEASGSGTTPTTATGKMVLLK
ncbi:MAG: S8 family peptidase [bacterium]|nr:S8 family peptidase [bacterium]